MNVSEIRELFPGLASEVYGKPLVYLDNAATSQRPQSVLDKMTEVAQKKNANIHRAVHRLSLEATEEYESARDAVKAFLNAGTREEIIFTSGTTAAINLVASSFGEAFIEKGDEILIAVCEHHSDIVPWQLLAGRKGAVIKVLPVDEDGRLQIERLKNLLTDRTKICCVAQVANVLGVKNPVDEIVSICHSRGCAVLVDGAQGVVHEGFDVQRNGCDFYAFSGHKVYAATGVGVLYGRKELLEKMPPYMGGGEMIERVSFTGTTYAPLPMKFEAGTQNFNAVPTLVPALKLADTFRKDEEVLRCQQEITGYLLYELKKIEGLRLYGDTAPEERIPLFSFSIEGVHHEDLALILDKMGFAVRSGQMCAEPIMDRYGVSGMLRASFAPYNTIEEAEAFVAALHKAVDMLR